jgi:phosphatidylinositol-3-phosphatase
MENHGYSQIVGNSAAPYENQLANQCGLATSYSGVTHPSLPNYIAATSGSTQGISDDGPPSQHPLAVASIFGQVQSKSYQESMPSNCLHSDSGNYVVKHNPEAYYTLVAADCQVNDVPMGSTSAGAFLNGLNSGLPRFSFVTPNLCNDMHDCSIGTGDSWLAAWLPRVFQSADYTSGHLAVFVTFDEDDGSSSNRVYTAVASPYTTPGTKSGTSFNHYSLLRTAEELFGVSLLGNAASANSMRSAFKLGGSAPPPPPPPPPSSPPPPPPSPASSCTKTITSTQTLQTFASSLVAGDVGCLTSRTYSGVVIRNGGTSASPITLQPAPGDSATIHGEVDFESGGNYWRLTGLTIDGASSSQRTIQVHVGGLRLDHNNITNENLGGSCIIDGSLQYGVSHGTIIDHNIIHNCGASNSAPYNHGVYVCCGYGTRVTNNVIYGNTGFGVQLYPDADSAVVDHNVIDGDALSHLSGVTFAGDTYGGCYATDSATVSDNIITNHHQFGVDHWFGCTPNGVGDRLAGNCFWNDPSGDFNAWGGTTASGNLHVDPLYVNRLIHNYALQAGSPCIGKGPQ